MLLKFIIVICTLHVLIVCGQVVLTEFGKVKGEQKALKDGTPLYEFVGIPYAVQPLGDLRFKDPEPLTESYPGGYFEATRTTRCVQFLPTIEKVIGQEDCLHLNIYTTTLDSEANHDVLIFIHGGAFAYGAGHSQSPEYLLDHNKHVVFASINYRLGPFGFLSTDDDVVPGNMGLKDQVLALQWIKNNIKNFGGNPENTVIAGLSAGGVSVHLHFLSPMSQDLFSKGISMSGVALSRLVKTRNIREEAENLINMFPECVKGSVIEKIKCLSKIDPIVLANTLIDQEVPWGDYNAYEHFGPVIEKGGDNPFLDEHPFHILRKGKVKKAPWLVSSTTAEGLFPCGSFIDNLEKIHELDKNWDSIAPYLLAFREFAKEEDLPKIGQQVRQHYLCNEPFSQDNRNKLIKLVGDRLYMTSIENAIRMHAAASRAPVYMYMFDYRGKHSFSTLLSKTDSNLGVSHSDDLIYVLKMAHFDILEDRAIHEMMMKIWSSFITEGIPDTGTGIHWPAVSRSITYVGNIDYVIIKFDGVPEVTSSSDLSERIFWDSLPLDELHISGDLYVPQYIQDLQKRTWIPAAGELKGHVIKDRLKRKNPLTAYLLKKNLGKSLSPLKEINSN